MACSSPEQALDVGVDCRIDIHTHLHADDDLRNDDASTKLAKTVAAKVMTFGISKSMATVYTSYTRAYATETTGFIANPLSVVPWSTKKGESVCNSENDSRKGS